MIVIAVFGISDATREAGLQAITRDLHALCSAEGDESYYVAFPKDWMEMDLGTELAVLVAGVPFDGRGMAFGRRVVEVLRGHFPAGTLIGLLLVDAITVMDLTSNPEGGTNRTSQ